jgi:hypothetical protein
LTRHEAPCRLPWARTNTTTTCLVLSQRQQNGLSGRKPPVKAGRSEGHKRGQYVISRKKRRWSCFHPPFLAPDSQRSCMKFGWSSEINRIDSMTNGVTRISLGVASISPAHLHLSSHPPQPHPQPPRSIPSIAFHSTQFTPRAKPPFDPVQVPPHAGSHHTHHTHTHTPHHTAHHNISARPSFLPPPHLHSFDNSYKSSSRWLRVQFT